MSKDRTRGTRLCPVSTAPGYWLAYPEHLESLNPGDVVYAWARDEAHATGIARKLLNEHFLALVRNEWLNKHRKVLGDVWSLGALHEEMSEKAQSLLRDLGMALANASTCAKCSLSEFPALRSSVVCPECDVCVECGHDEFCSVSTGILEPDEDDEEEDFDQYDDQELEDPCEWCGSTLCICTDDEIDRRDASESLVAEAEHEFEEPPENEPDEMEKCICLYNDFTGKSVCGVPCPVHAPKSVSE